MHAIAILSPISMKTTLGVEKGSPFLRLVVATEWKEAESYSPSTVAQRVSTN